MNRFFIFIITLCFFLGLPLTAHAHPGRTDSKGGHTNHSTGDYHYHHGESAHQHYDIDGNGSPDCPLTFDGSDRQTQSPLVGIAAVICVACPIIGATLGSSKEK